MAFFARVSDPALGGTYMTFLNTLSNLGGNWPTTLAFWALDYTTYKSCTIGGHNCSGQEGQQVGTLLLRSFFVILLLLPQLIFMYSVQQCTSRMTKQIADDVCS